MLFPCSPACGHVEARKYLSLDLAGFLFSCATPKPTHTTSFILRPASGPPCPAQALSREGAELALSDRCVVWGFNDSRTVGSVAQAYPEAKLPLAFCLQLLLLQAWNAHQLKLKNLLEIS